MKKLLIAAMLVTLPVLSIADAFKVDTGCEVKFSPHGGAEQAIVKLIGTAKQEITVLAYSFTSQPIAEALVAAKKRGVHVQLILDKSQQTANGSKLGLVVQNGLDVWIDSKHAIAHNKVMTVDGKFFENGSFNYTNAAENSNGENALICQSVSGAAVFKADFEKHKLHSVKQ